MRGNQDVNIRPMRPFSLAERGEAWGEKHYIGLLKSLGFVKNQLKDDK